MNRIVKVIVALLVGFMMVNCSSRNKSEDTNISETPENPVFTTYVYKDYFDVEYTIKLFKDRTGTITTRMDGDLSDSEETKCSWYLDKYLGKVEITTSDGIYLYVYDGYIYDDYFAMKAKDTDKAFKVTVK